MPLKDVLEKRLISCPRSSSVEEVANLMKKHLIGSVVVVDNDRPVGIVTDRDIVLRCICEGHNCSEMTVEEIMTNDVCTVDVESGIYELIEQMKEHAIRRVVVVDKTGKPVSIVSFGDVYRLLTKEMNELSSSLMPEEPRFKKAA